MSLNSHIEWTDATWNPVRGCTMVSPGCKFCYAEVFSERFRGVPALEGDHVLEAGPLGNRDRRGEITESPYLSETYLMNSMNRT